MKTVLCIVGARPQFIKHAPVVKAFREHFKTVTAHTCQHYDHNMSQVFFDELDIPAPEFLLENQAKGASQGRQTASMLMDIETLLLEQKPDAVLVYGDTNSTLAGALAASKLHIPIIHVEAGLRSFNREMPEEVNRVLTDHVSSLLFAPTDVAVENLAREGITEGVHQVGDVMFDAVRLQAERLTQKTETPYIFATLHRPYNVDIPERLEEILNRLNEAPCRVVLPLHPRTLKTLTGAGLTTEQFENIEFTEPVGYLDCLSLQKFCRFVVTDSGGIQKESYALQTPCITVRYETEWVETLEGGCNTLVGEDLSTLSTVLSQETERSFGEPYGDGRSAALMARLCLEFFDRL